jgi:hypothetical protein
MEVLPVNEPKPPEKKIGKSLEALEHALDIRKFEIELYWKRASYFWVLIGAALVAYITVVAKDASHKGELSVVISSLGLVFSCAWLAVNKGSKFWQENWEKHVDMLEDEHIGSLYKIVFNNDKGLFSLGGSIYSVSKINLVVSFYVAILWLGLLVASVSSIWYPALLRNFSGHLITLSAFFSCGFCCWFLFFNACKTGINFKAEDRLKAVAVLRVKPLE